MSSPVPSDLARTRLTAMLRRRSNATAGGGEPLTATQEGIWLAEQLDPGLSGYHDTAVLRLTGPVDLVELRGALTDAQECHEALRARVVDADGEPRQVFDVKELDWEHLDLDPAALPTLVRRCAARPFELEKGPLWRATAARTGAAEHHLVLVLHHLVTDGWSHGVLLATLLRCYAARIEGRVAAPEPVPPPSYADWLRLKVRREQAAAGDVQAVAHRLAGAPRRFELPGLLTDRAGERDRTAAAVPLPVDAGDRQAFAGVCRQAGASPFMAMAGLLGLLLTRETGEPRVVVSAPVAHRADPGTAALHGCLIDLLPIAVPVLRAGVPPPAAVGLGRDAVAMALQTADVPYRAVARAVGAEPGADDPLTNIALEEFNAPAGVRTVGPLRIEVLPRTAVRLRHDLALSVSRDATGPLELLYPLAKWTPGAVEALAAGLAELVAAVR